MAPQRSHHQSPLAAARFSPKPQAYGAPKASMWPQAHHGAASCGCRIRGLESGFSTLFNS